VKRTVGGTSGQRTVAAFAGRSAMKIQKMTRQISVMRMRLPRDFSGVKRIFANEKTGRTKARAIVFAPLPGLIAL